MGKVSRRQVALGAAWSVPVVAVGAAAPALAASGCPTISLVDVTQASTGTLWGVQFTLLGFQTGAATYSGSVTLHQRNTATNVVTERTGTWSTTYDGAAGSITLTAYTPRQGPSVWVDVTIFITTPVVCQASFTAPA
jgi:hypothetical protein